MRGSWKQSSRDEDEIKGDPSARIRLRQPQSMHVAFRERSKDGKAGPASAKCDKLKNNTPEIAKSSSFQILGVCLAR